MVLEHGRLRSASRLQGLRPGPQSRAASLDFIRAQHAIGTVLESIECRLRFGAKPAVVIGAGLGGLMRGFQGKAAVGAGSFFQRAVFGAPLGGVHPAFILIVN